MHGDATVVGGGLAGLVAATRLAEAGADVTLYERRPEVGGRVRTETVNGFTLDRGFQVFFTSYPAVVAELDIDALDIRQFAPGATICRPGSRSVLSDPLRDPRAAIASLLNDEVSLSDKLRTLALRHDLAKRDEGAFFTGRDASIREYLHDWGFADDYVTNFVEPFYGGITLDRTLSTSKHVFEYTFRAMSRGTIAVPAAGMRAIPEALAARARDAGVTIETGEDVESVRTAGQGRIPFRTGAATPQAPRSSWRTARPARPMRSSSRPRRPRPVGSQASSRYPPRVSQTSPAGTHSPRASRSRPGSAYCSTRPTTRPTPWSRCRRSRPSTPPTTAP